MPRREVRKVRKKGKISSRRCDRKYTRHKRMLFSKLLREIKINVLIYLTSLQYRIKRKKDRFVNLIVLSKRYAILKANEHFQRIKRAGMRFVMRCKDALHRVEKGQKLCLETAHVLVCQLVLKSKEQKQRLQSKGVSVVGSARALVRAAILQMKMELYLKSKQCIKSFGLLRQWFWATYQKQCCRLKSLSGRCIRIVRLSKSTAAEFLTKQGKQCIKVLRRLKRQLLLNLQEQHGRIEQKGMRYIKRMRKVARKTSQFLLRSLLLSVKECAKLKAQVQCLWARGGRWMRRLRRLSWQSFTRARRQWRMFKEAYPELVLIISDPFRRSISQCKTLLQRMRSMVFRLIRQLFAHRKKQSKPIKDACPQPIVYLSALPFFVWMKRSCRSIKRVAFQSIQAPRHLKAHISFSFQAVLQRIKFRALRLVKDISVRGRRFFAQMKRPQYWMKGIRRPLSHMPKKLKEEASFHSERQWKRIQATIGSFILRLRAGARYLFRQMKKSLFLLQKTSNCWDRISIFSRRAVLSFKKQWRLLRLQKRRFIQQVRILERETDRKNQDRWERFKFYVLAGWYVVSEFSHQVFQRCKKQFQGLSSAWDTRSILSGLHRKRKFITACCFLALFIPVLFLKVVRNGIHSLLTQNAAHNSFGKERWDLNSDGLLCFNEESRMSFFHSNKIERKNDAPLLAARAEKAAATKEIGPLRKILANIKTEIDPLSKNEELLAAADGFFSSSKSTNAAEEASSGEWAPQRLFLRNVQETNDGFGDVKNYWTLDVLVAPLFKPGHVLPLIDVRWHEFSDDRQSNRFAANVGLMARYIPTSCAPIIGGNLYYDYRHSTIDKGWNRWGVGMEILGKRWDFRLNGYFPIGSKLHMRKCTFDDFDGGYKMVQRKYEFMFTGFNADIGSRAIVTKNWQLYILGGTYYLNGRCHSKTWGFRMGLRPQFKDYVALDLSVSHDHLFKTIYQGQLIFSLPLYSFGAQKNKTGPCGITQQQIYQPVERFDIIPVQRDCCWEQNF